MRLCSILAMITVVMVNASVAEPVDSKTARKALFSGKGREVEIFDADFMGEAETSALESYAKQFEYYGAFAVSAGDPAENQSAVGLANFHSEAAARAAALEACNEKRTTGRACMILAVVRPRGYKPSDLELSAEASDAVRKAYRKLDAPKGFAVSPQSGAWAMARGDGGRALATCNSRSGGANDCVLAIQDK